MPSTNSSCDSRYPVRKLTNLVISLTRHYQRFSIYVYTLKRIISHNLISNKCFKKVTGKKKCTIALEFRLVLYEERSYESFNT